MSHLTLLNLDAPVITANTAPTGLSLKDIESMEQFLIGIRTHTGQMVTPEKARRCATVLACIRILTEDLACLRLPLYKNTNVDGVLIPVEVPDHPVHALLNAAPNDTMTPLELREHILLDLLIWGSFFVLKNEDPYEPGVVSSLWPLQAGYCVRRWRELVWTFSDPLTGISGQFTPDVVWRGTILSSNAVDGVALTLLAREAIGLLLAAEEQGARLFSHGIQTDFVLETADAVGDQEKDQLRQALMLRHSGSWNAWMPLILEGGLKASKLGLTAQESQYIEARKYQTEDIARVFRIPEVLLGNSTSGKSSTYASAEQFFQSYTKHTLTPWAVRIEQTVHRDLLTSKERQKYYVKHDFSSLLRADTAGRYASYATGIDKGFITPGWAARQEQLPWKPELEYYVRQGVQAAPDANAQDERSKPTDQSGLAKRVAQLILKKEASALQRGQEPDIFYTHFGGYIEDLTGADAESVAAYLESRRTNKERFSAESKAKAIDALILLCKKDN